MNLSDAFHARSLPGSSDAAQACPKHDATAAKQLLTEAGAVAPVKVSMVLANTAEERRLGEAIQAQVNNARWTARQVLAVYKRVSQLAGLKLLL